MQDGAFTSLNLLKKLLQDTFGADRVISRSFENIWPPSSPDLNSCDFYLWGHLEYIYRKRHASAAELKSSITTREACYNLDFKCDSGPCRFMFLTCSGIWGSHIEHII